MIPEIRVYPVELAYLAMLLDADYLLGIADPFTGLLTEEIIESLRDARKSLTDKGLIAEDGNGAIKIDAIAMYIIDAYSRPEVSYIAYRKHVVEGEDIRVYHITRQLSVEQFLPDEPGGELILTIHERVDEANSRIEELLHIEDAESNATIGFRLSMNELWGIFNKVGDKPEDLERYIGELGLGNNETENIVETLDSSTYISILLGMKPKAGEWENAGIIFLGNRRHIFKITPRLGGQSIQAEAVSCGYHDAKNELKRFIQDMVPVLTG